MNKDANTVVEGEVLEALPNTMFKVALSDGRNVLCTLTGRMRRRYIRVFPGDKVKVEMTKYDTDRGRIAFKFDKR